MPDGETPTVDSDGNITPEAWVLAIKNAPTHGMTRAQFIKAFGSMIASPDGKVSTKFGLTPVEVRSITADASTASLTDL